jgi:hypothetical protein
MIFKEVAYLKVVDKRLRKLERMFPQTVQLLVMMDNKKVEMSIPEYLQLPEVKIFPEWLEKHSPYEKYQLPTFEVVAPKYERLSAENVNELCRLNDATIGNIIRHTAPNRNIEDYE